MERIEKLLTEIESILVDAGETCPKDYQNGFDWKKYMAYVNTVKKEVINHNNYTLSLIKQLKNLLTQKDMITLAEDDHEVMKFIDLHLLSDKIKE